MAGGATAARDPIFWLHHANVDRIWAEWQVNFPGRTPSESLWTDWPFNFFDTQGSITTKTPGQVADTQALNYVYGS